MEQAQQRKLSQPTLRYFVRHMGLAAGRQKERDDKLAGLDSQISIVKKKALDRRSNKETVEQEFNSLRLRIKELINEERVLVLNQRREGREGEEMRERLELLEEKIHGISNVHSIELHDLMGKIDELSRKLADARAESAKRDKEIESISRDGKNVQHNRELVIQVMKELGDKKRKENITELKRMIKEAEEHHKELQEKRVPRKHLDRLKKVIEEHKKKLSQLS